MFLTRNLVQATRFFMERVYCEEFKLLQFFGVEYAAYAAKTPILMPSVRGYLSQQEYQSLVRNH
jgi:protein-S-isoprenylcysteine O-methyltransferase Ste14